MQLAEIAKQFGFIECTIDAFGTGLINNTWLVTPSGSSSKYILQRINTNIFKQPENIAFNIRLIADHLAKFHPDYFFTEPLKTISGLDIQIDGNDVYRMFEFVKDSHTIDVVQTTDQAYEASKAFGIFTNVLADFNASLLKITLPGFHDLSLRFKQFEIAVKSGIKERITASKHLIDFLFSQKNIVNQYEQIKQDPDFKIRVTHHDTKISNVLFNKDEKCICVIDLDTVMPGYFISDVGDMMRTYLSPVTEEQIDFTRINARKEFFDAIVEGYSAGMKDELTKKEQGYFLYAGQFIIYMQSLRFLTDHLSNDVYYGAKYEGHNFNRAGNQIELLKQLQSFERL